MIEDGAFVVYTKQVTLVDKIEVDAERVLKERWCQVCAQWLVKPIEVYLTTQKVSGSIGSRTVM